MPLEPLHLVGSHASRICSVSVSARKPAEHIAQIRDAKSVRIDVDEVMPPPARFPIGLREHQAVFLRVTPKRGVGRFLKYATHGVHFAGQRRDGVAVQGPTAKWRTVSREIACGSPNPDLRHFGDEDGSDVGRWQVVQGHNWYAGVQLRLQTGNTRDIGTGECQIAHCGDLGNGFKCRNRLNLPSRPPGGNGRPGGVVLRHHLRNRHGRVRPGFVQLAQPNARGATRI
ncbi:hypothetical protein LMG1873_05346 [Achromobacter piechaudii]|uniref:Uncharacterized protein n=1 Tax=Achromobacter piechaudii TaxID=72556 RepID=A0ABM8L4Q6_9BURK|nr:hypothetical protein LMG1873_05346 [Achromobacter piechaudii]